MRPLFIPAALFLAALLPTGFFSTGALSQGFDTRASHAVIMDYESGDMLFSKNGEEPMPPASMSKLMTALMVFEALESGELSMETELPVSENAWRRGGSASGSSTMFLDVGSRATVRDLLQGIIVQSGNDACIVVAEAIGGTEENFSDMMTERARELGLESANFANSTGWPDADHRISASDLARLARHIIEEHPAYYGIYAQGEYTYNGIRQFNRNPLLGLFPGTDGLKTGHTSQSGYGLVASAEQDGERRIVVFNGMESNRARADEAERLMRAAFNEFEMVRIIEAGAQLGEADLYMGQSETVALRAAEGLSVGMHRRTMDDYTAEIVYEGPVQAPVVEGDRIARLVITLPDGHTRSVPLEAAASVERKGMFGRAGAALVQMIRGG
ncbi:D-alanyl-D-alanine carboxypeptidase family protein [Maricaulaceae bacterium MS644]